MGWIVRLSPTLANASMPGHYSDVIYVPAYEPEMYKGDQCESNAPLVEETLTATKRCIIDVSTPVGAHYGESCAWSARLVGCC